MKRGIVILAVIVISAIIIQVPVFAAPYWNDTGRKTLNGVKNVTSSPAEVVIALGSKDQLAGAPIGLRQLGLAGIGVLNGLKRAAQGIVELGLALVPDKDAKFCEPETLF